MLSVFLFVNFVRKFFLEFRDVKFVGVESGYKGLGT